jgi:hypothetical protein
METTRAKFDANIIGNFGPLLAAIGPLIAAPPTDFSVPVVAPAAWTQLNVELANLLAKAVASPLTAIINRGIVVAATNAAVAAGAAPGPAAAAVVAGAAPAITAVSAALAESLVGNPPGVGAAIVPLVMAPPAPGAVPAAAVAAVVNAFVVAAGGAPGAIVAAVGGGVLPGVIAGAVVSAINSVPTVQIPNEFIACATLILGAAKAVYSVPVPVPVAPATVLTAASVNAAAAAAVAGGVGTLGSIFRAVGGIVNARNLVNGYIGAGGAMAAAHAVGAGAAVFGGAALLNEAYKLHCHLAERGHFWPNAVVLPGGLAPNLHFLAWTRAARTSLDTQVPPNHSSFVLPPPPLVGNAIAAAAIANGAVAGPGVNALVHLHSLLAAANAAYHVPGANTCLSWNNVCKDTNGVNIAVAAVPNLTALPAPANTVGIHLDLSAAPVGVGGSVIKCDLRGDNGGGGFLLDNHLLRSFPAPVGGAAPPAPVHLQMADAATALGEAAATVQLVGVVPIAYLAPLPTGAIPAPPAATPGAPAPTGRITLFVNRNEGVGTLFAE